MVFLLITSFSAEDKTSIKKTTLTFDSKKNDAPVANMPHVTSTDPVTYNPIKPADREQKINNPIKTKEKSESNYGVLLSYLIFCIIVFTLILIPGVRKHVKKRIPKTIQNNVEVKKQKFRLISLSLKWINSNAREVKNSMYLCLALLLGFLGGWYFKLPNAELLTKLSRYDSLWRTNIAVKILKGKSSFFSTDNFDFNWIAFFLSTFLCFFFLMFFNDKIFRQYLYNKFTFKEEKGSH